MRRPVIIDPASGLPTEGGPTYWFHWEIPYWTVAATLMLMLGAHLVHHDPLTRRMCRLPPAIEGTP